MISLFIILYIYLGYHSVVLIPPGAINVHIKQSSLDDNIDDNYIGKICIMLQCF